MEMTILQVKKIYDGTRKGEIPEGVLVFDETGILEVLPGWENAPVSRYEQAGRSVAVIDARDVCLVPGLIDSHVHLMMPGDGMKGEEVVSTMSQGEIQLVAGRNAAQALFAGVTTLRDCGGIADVTFSLKSAIEKGLVAGPDLLVCGSPITSTGGHIHYMGGEADGEEEIRRLVRRQEKGGRFRKDRGNRRGNARSCRKGNEPDASRNQLRCGGGTQASSQGDGPCKQYQGS